MSLHQPVKPGDLIGDQFRVVRPLGAGGMGAVYLAEQLNIGRPVVIKFMHAHLAHQQRHIARFRREATLLSMIHHPNVVVVYTFGETKDGHLYLVMEYLEGQSLAQLMSDKEPFQLGRAFDIVEQILSALVQAHSSGVVHRDLKPDNIILTHTADHVERVKVLDFGIASFTHADLTALTQEDAVIGTPRYMSPEQVNGDAVDGRSDLYALGVIFYELLTGTHPLKATSQAQFLVAHLTQEIQPPSAQRLGASIPEAVDLLVLKALARDATQRFSSAHEMLSALLAIRQQLSVSAVSFPRVGSVDDVGADDEAHEAFVTAKMVAVPAAPAFSGVASSPQLSRALRSQDLGVVPTGEATSGPASPDAIPPTEEQPQPLFSPGMVVYGLGPGPNWLLAPTDNYERPDKIHFIPPSAEDQAEQREIRRLKALESQRKRAFLAYLSRRHRAIRLARDQQERDARSWPNLATSSLRAGARRLVAWCRRRPLRVSFFSAFALSLPLITAARSAWLDPPPSGPALIAAPAPQEGFPDFRDPAARRSAWLRTPSARPDLSAAAPSDPAPSLEAAPAPSPDAAPAPAPPRRIQSLHAGAYVTYALLDGGQVAAWGYNRRGQLGIGRALEDSSSPVLVRGLPAPAASLSVGGGAGGLHDATACARLEGGRVFCWGDAALVPNEPDGALTSPREVPSLYGSLQVALGSQHGCALSASRELACWGYGPLLGLGPEPPSNAKKTPHPLPLEGPWRDVVAGPSHTCALHSDGRLLCWGANDKRQASPTSAEPTLTQPTLHSQWPVAPEAVALGHHITYLLGKLAEGEPVALRASGEGMEGLQRLPGEPLQVSAFARNACALDRVVGLACWGDAGYGQLGVGRTDLGVVAPQEAKPVWLSGQGAGVVQVAVGATHACALRADDQVLCWGSNAFGALGDGTLTDRAAPVLVDIPAAADLASAQPTSPNAPADMPTPAQPPAHPDCAQGTRLRWRDDAVPASAAWRPLDAVARLEETGQTIAVGLRFADAPLPVRPLLPFMDEFALRGERRALYLKLSAPGVEGGPDAPPPLGRYTTADLTLRLSDARVVDRYGSEPRLLEGATPESGVVLRAVVDGWVCGEVLIQYAHGALSGPFAAPLRAR